DDRVTDLEGGSASLPDGGTTGQVLLKASSADQDVQWSSLVRVDNTAGKAVYIQPAPGEPEVLVSYESGLRDITSLATGLAPNDAGSIYISRSMHEVTLTLSYLSLSEGSGTLSFLLLPTGWWTYPVAYRPARVWVGNSSSIEYFDFTVGVDVSWRAHVVEG